MDWFTLFKISVVAYLMLTENLTHGQVFTKAIKNVPRIGRKSGSADDFENFFLKASKSVPRIGRKNYEQEPRFDEYPDFYLRRAPQITKKAGNHFKEVPWAEIADMVEYYPEIMLMSPPMWSEGAFRDNYQFEDYGKRKIPEQMPGNNMEIPEYRKQPIP